jgi:EpsI family protein
MQMRRREVTLAVLMIGTSVGAYALRPGKVLPPSVPPIVLDTAVPKAFADWTFLPDRTVQVVDPQTQQVLDTVYSQVLTRTYVNKQGYGVMLSVAYGGDQRDGLTAHKPEVCYPAQGFTVNSLQDGTLATPFGGISVRRLATNNGSRNEPVTYWFTEGDEVVKSRFDRRMAQMKAYLTGQIPDGVLFRISSIDADPAKAFAIQQQFANDLLQSVAAKDLKKLSGLNARGTAA